MGNVKPIPDGYHSVTPYLYVDGAIKALAFYRKAFGATERMRMENPDGTIRHAEIEIGDSAIMLSDVPRRDGASAPLGSLVLYVDDVDTVFRKAIDYGAEVLQPLQNKFYGDRTAMIRDPFGQEWSLATHIEDVSEQEMQRRMAESFAGLSEG